MPFEFKTKMNCTISASSKFTFVLPKRQIIRGVVVVSPMKEPMWNHTVGWRSAFAEHPCVIDMIDRLITVEIEGQQAILSELAVYLSKFI
jgi:hypothetical protein